MRSMLWAVLVISVALGMVGPTIGGMVIFPDRQIIMLPPDAPEPMSSWLGEYEMCWPDQNADIDCALEAGVLLWSIKQEGNEWIVYGWYGWATYDGWQISQPGGFYFKANLIRDWGRIRGFKFISPNGTPLEFRYNKRNGDFKAIFGSGYWANEAIARKRSKTAQAP